MSDKMTRMTAASWSVTFQMLEPKVTVLECTASSITAEYKWPDIGTEGPRPGGKAKALGQSLATLGTSR